MEDYVQRLLEELTGHDGMVRKLAREKLVLIGDPVVPQLRSLLASSQKQVRWEATKALAAIEDSSCLGDFLALLDDPESDLRWLAATGLTQLGPRAARPVLQGLTDPDAPRGRLEMSRRVLAELASDNKVLRDIAAPILEVIGENNRAVITERAARALSDFDSATGLQPSSQTG